jgi:hypothetical protein
MKKIYVFVVLLPLKQLYQNLKQNQCLLALWDNVTGRVDECDVKIASAI